MVRLKIGQRILLLFLAVSLLPLLAVNFLLLNLAQKQLKQAATTRQSIIATQTAERVDNFLGSKVNVLIFQSQTNAIRKFQTSEANLNLATMIKQDRDIRDSRERYGEASTPSRIATSAIRERAYDEACALSRIADAAARRHNGEVYGLPSAAPLTIFFAMLQRCTSLGPS